MGSASESMEIERKYEVPADAEAPDAAAFTAIGLTAGRRITHELHARYFDTRDGELARKGYALRMRAGGSDAGWHLKERTSAGTRELHWPLSGTPPEGLAAELRTRLDLDVSDIVPLAELRTERRSVRLSEANGAEVVEFADDRVLATTETAHGRTVRRAWREWEAELLVGADPHWLDRIEAVLLAAGAHPSPSSAKIARATGSLVRLARERGATPEVIAELEAMDRSDQAAARRVVL